MSLLPALQTVAISIRYILSMHEESHDPDHPLDGQYNNAEMAAAGLVTAAKTVGLTEVELPVVDTNAVWTVSVKRLGIENPREQVMPFLDPNEEPDPQSDLP